MTTQQNLLQKFTGSSFKESIQQGTKNIHDLWKLPNGLFLEKNSQIQCYV